MAEQSCEKLLSDMLVVLKGVNWHDLGTHLHVPQDRLNAIELGDQNTQTRLTKVLNYHQHNGELSWEKIIEALKKIGSHANLIVSIQSTYITPVCTGQQASAISAASNTQLETDDMHIDTIATSTGTENKRALNGATGNEQIEMVEEMDVDQISSDLDGSKKVKIGSETYSLDVVPAAESRIVSEEKNMLLGVMDLKTLVDDLGRAGAFIRFAYNGVMAAGPRYTEIQIEIQQLGIDITKLCNESQHTVSQFEMASATVLSNLKATYGYLLRNKANLAIDMLSSVSEIAGKMEESALELHSKFEKEEKEVAKTVQKTQRARAEAATSREEKEKKQQELQIQLQHEEQMLEDAQRLEREAEAHHQQIEAKEDEAISGISLIEAFINIFWSGEGLRKVDRLREKRIRASEIEIRRRQERYAAMERRTAYTIKIQNCKSEQEMAEGAEEALYNTERELKELSVIMMQTAQFWKQIHDYCKSLIEERVKSMATTIESTKKEADRIKTWTSQPFKEQAVRFYAGWVALNTVCSEYAEHIKKTQKELYKYIVESPTYDEARRNIHELAETFRTNLRKEMAALEQDSK